MKLRLAADVLAALRATGDGWQTRINDMLHASSPLTREILVVASVPSHAERFIPAYAGNKYLANR